MRCRPLICGRVEGGSKQQDSFKKKNGKLQGNPHGETNDLERVDRLKKKSLFFSDRSDIFTVRFK
jgi:hypothetical protein